jgi:hypothetical protein
MGYVMGRKCGWPYLRTIRVPFRKASGRIPVKAFGDSRVKGMGQGFNSRQAFINCVPLDRKSRHTHKGWVGEGRGFT